MIKFLDFRKHFQKKYISLRLSDSSQDKMRYWCESNGFKLNVNGLGEEVNPRDFDFHITVFYTTNKSFMKPRTIEITPIPISFEKFEKLGPDKNITTLLVKRTPKLMNIREIFEAIGLKDSWPSWKPHVTVDYIPNKIKLRNLPIPSMALFVDKLIIDHQ